MIVKRTWVKNRSYGWHGRKNAYTRRYIYHGWFLFGIFPVYIVRMNV